MVTFYFAVILVAEYHSPPLLVVLFLLPFLWKPFSSEQIGKKERKKKKDSKERKKEIIQGV
jgi:hypothetical protein